MNHDKLEVEHTKLIRFITEDRFRYLRHLVLLLGILALLSFSRDVTNYYGSQRYLKVVLIYIPLILMCYVNMNILVPVFFFKGKYGLYLVFLVIVVSLLMIFISNLLELFLLRENLTYHEEGSYNKRGFYEGIIILIPIILVTTMIKLFQRWMRDNERIKELNKITYTMELKELKNQINPHFLFNMLNGIKSLIRSNPEKANMVIMKLSEFLRYQLYENTEEKTLLRSELDFLSNFLELEKIRRDNLSVSISSETDAHVLNSVFLYPNLFTTFVENAVKHSVDIDQNESYVKVRVNVADNKIHFSCVNSKDPDYRPSSDGKNSGLGLANIRRRLELLYGTEHTLDIESTKTEYKIKLTMPL